MPRIEIELTSARPDGTWTWRAAGARQPKGTLDADVLPGGAKVGDVLRADADIDIDGITVRSTAPVSPKKGAPPERIEIVGSGREEPAVTTNMRGGVEAGGERERGRGADRGRDRDRGGGGGGGGRPGGRGPGGPGGPGGPSRRPDGGGGGAFRPADRSGRDGRPTEAARPGAGDAGRPRSDRPTRDRPPSDRAFPPGDRPPGDRPAANRPIGGRPPGERSGASRPAADRPPRTDRSAGERGERPARGAPRPAEAPKPKAKRLQPGRVYRDAVLAELSPERTAVAEQILRGGIPAVRQAVEEQNAKAREVGGPEIKADALLAVAEELLPALKAAEWRDRAEAAVAIVDEISVRDLRAVVIGADTARDEEGRALAATLREALDRRAAAERQTWVDEITSSLDEGRIVRALRISGRPPEPGVRFPAELAKRLSDATGDALAPDTTADRWTAVLEAVMASPVRRTITPKGLPAEPGEALTRALRLAAPRVPAIAALLGDPPGAPPRRPARPGPPRGAPGAGGGRPPGRPATPPPGRPPTPPTAAASPSEAPAPESVRDAEPVAVAETVDPTPPTAPAAPSEAAAPEAVEPTAQSDATPADAAPPAAADPSEAPAPDPEPETVPAATGPVAGEDATPPEVEATPDAHRAGPPVRSGEIEA